MAATLLATNLCKDVGDLGSQCRTMLLSVQAVTASRGMWRTSQVWVTSLARRSAPDNSALGVVRGLVGSTLALATTRAVLGGEVGESERA